MKLVIPEDGSAEARALYDSAAGVFSSRLLLPEAYAAVGRAHRSGRLEAATSSSGLEKVRMLLTNVFPIEVTASVAEDASHLATAQALRGYDAVHLASYLKLSTKSAVLIAADGELVRAAASLGLAVAVPRD